MGTDAEIEPTHRAVVEQARAAREARLRDPSGWLSLVGLHWLAPGRQRFGSDPANEIVLHAEAGEVPPVAGVLEVAAERVIVHAEHGSTLAIAGELVAGPVELADDEADAPTTLELASLRMVLIRRSEGRLGLRVRDTRARAIGSFGGLDHFAIDPRWRLDARLVRAAAGATIPVPDILGGVVDAPSPGVVEFDLDGQTHRLSALEAGPDTLFLIFADRTSGRETYGGGRFLVTGQVQPDDTVELDFNLAYNPPCVFSPYATCPTPPLGNRLDVPIEAGEKTWTAPGAIN